MIFIHLVIFKPQARSTTTAFETTLDLGFLKFDRPASDFIVSCSKVLYSLDMVITEYSHYLMSTTLFFISLSYSAYATDLSQGSPELLASYSL